MVVVETHRRWQVQGKLRQELSIAEDFASELNLGQVQTEGSIHWMVWGTPGLIASSQRCHSWTTANESKQLRHWWIKRFKKMACQQSWKRLHEWGGVEGFHWLDPCYCLRCPSSIQRTRLWSHSGSFWCQLHSPPPLTLLSQVQLQSSVVYTASPWRL